MDLAGRSTAIGASYLFVVLVCVAVSVWTVFEGTKSLVGPVMSALFAAIIGVGLFAADISIRQARKNAAPLWKPLAFLGVCMIASGPSHFNFFYYHAVGQNDAIENLAEAREAIASLKEASSRQLESANATETLADSVNAKFAEYRRQVSQTGFAGHGPIAEGIIDSIQQELGLTFFPRPALGTAGPRAREWADNILKPEIIDPELERRRAEEPVVQTLESIAVANTRLETTEQAITNGRTDTALSAQEAIDLIINYEATYNTIKDLTTSRLQALGSTFIYDGANAVDHQNVVRDNIPASMVSGFIKVPYPGVTGFALMAGLLIDLIPTLFVLLLTKTKREDAGLPEPSKRNKKSRGGTIEIN